MSLGKLQAHLERTGFGGHACQEYRQMALLRKHWPGLTIDARPSMRGPQMANDKSLSPREQEVLQLLWEGFRTRDIAQALHRSFNTVAMHRKHILEKLGARSTAAAFKIALKQRLIIPHVQPSPPTVSASPISSSTSTMTARGKPLALSNLLHLTET